MLGTKCIVSLSDNCYGNIYRLDYEFVCSIENNNLAKTFFSLQQYSKFLHILLDI